MDTKTTERIDLSAKGLLRKVRGIFNQVKQPQKGTRGIKKSISIGDCLMSALAVFKLKYPSLLQFEEHRRQEPIEQNLINLFGLKNVPCDTYMRERLDEIDPYEIRKAFSIICFIVNSSLEIKLFTAHE